MRQIAIVVCLIFYFCSSGAQNFVGWTEHLPFRKAKQLIASSNNIFCLTESGLFSYSLIDNEITTFTKTNTLSDSEITSIAWASDFEQLIVGYNNGNIDLLTNNKLINIPDIKRFTGFTEKQITSIHISNDIAYLGTGFGIVALNLSKHEIADTYLIGSESSKVKVNDVVTDEEYIWAATDSGVYRARLKSSNLADFNNWVRIIDIPNYTEACLKMIIVGKQLFVLRNVSESSSVIYRFKNELWTLFHGEPEIINSIKTFNDRLYVVINKKIKEFNQEGVVLNTIESNLGYFRDFLQVDNRTFIADFEKSLIEKQGTEFIPIKPDGPLESDISTIYSTGNQTWTSAGLTNENIPAELFVYSGSNWVNLTANEIPELSAKKNITQIVASKTNDSKVFAGSWSDGIFEFENLKLNNYYHSGNSPLGTIGISSIDSDLNGNLWVLDANSNEGIKVLADNNEWITLSYNGLDNVVDSRKILALQNGDKWVLRGLGSSLFAFNENGTIANNDDDVKAFFTVRDENNSNISSQIYDLVEDLDGNVWVGTSSGIAVYSNPGAIFREGSFFAYRPIITFEGSTQYLLSTEKIQCVEVNGANQKWIGTENSGAFLVSENGEEQLAHFNAQNSPIPSNNIKKISVNPHSGEVFFVTDKGMVSYRGKVTQGTDNFTDLYVYPNPVRETYNGDITVSGLMSNSIVKITNVSGNLVWEGKSEGGQFIWDGRNFNGSRVHTGIYLIFCSNFDGSKSKVIKLLFIH